MDQVEQRRTNLSELIDLAQATRGWSRRELAQALGRDPSRLIPHSGVPKLDLILALTRILDWPLADVVEHVWKLSTGVPLIGSARMVEGSYEELMDNSKAAQLDGGFAAMIRFARQAFRTANTPSERALACNREMGGWNGLGCHSEAQRALRLGLNEQHLAGDVRRLLTTNLAATYYGLGALTEAKSVSQSLFDWYRANPPSNIRDRKACAFVLFVLGQTMRRLSVELVEPRAGTMARECVRNSLDQHAILASELGDTSYLGIANTCRAALLEVDVHLERITADHAIRELADGLDAVIDCESCQSGDWLESFGWWCLTGCDLVARHAMASPPAEELMALFTNKADEIAERLDNWWLRERILIIESTRWQASDVEAPCILDADDVRKVLGCMGRFPRFWPIGMRLLHGTGLV